MDELIISGEQKIFNRELFEQCGFIRARYHTWQEFRNGLVTFVGKDFIRVLFQLKIYSPTSYYTIRMAEIEAGLWSITYSPDLQRVFNIEMEND